MDGIQGDADFIAALFTLQRFLALPSVSIFSIPYLVHVFLVNVWGNDAMNKDRIDIIDAAIFVKRSQNPPTVMMAMMMNPTHFCTPFGAEMQSTDPSCSAKSIAERPGTGACYLLDVAMKRNFGGSQIPS